MEQSAGPPTLTSGNSLFRRFSTFTKNLTNSSRRSALRLFLGSRSLTPPLKLHMLLEPSGSFQISQYLIGRTLPSGVPQPFS